MKGFSEREQHAVILGALLHDLGKFIQRAQKNPRSQDHSHWGEEWFEDNLAEKLTTLFEIEEKQIIRSAISNHHGHERFVSLADAISAGMDRISMEAEEEKGDPFTDRLISIFSRISLSGQMKTEKYHKLLHLGSQNIEETFPIGEKKCSFSEYAGLLKALEGELHEMDFRNSSTLNIIDTLYFLLWKYAWCIPSAAYKDEPDVSLFDHLKTTAAIAACLYAYQRENPHEALDLESKVFCLIGGDLSGIQNYIFSVLTQQGKIAKRLRARSLFVQLISEIASHKLLHTFDLPLCNLIGSAGGNFYILIPNSRETDVRVAELQKEFDTWTLTHLNAEIAISLASVKLCGRDFSNFSVILDEQLKPNLNVNKYRPHNSALYSNTGWQQEEFLRPEVVEGDDKVCDGCRMHPQYETERNEDNLCIRCFDDTIIGQILPKAKYIAFFDNESHKHKVLNYSFELWDDRDMSNQLSYRPYLILTLNSPQVKPPVTGFKYLATHVPKNEDNNQLLSFDEIAGTSEGDRLLGYIKADVDNLGDILRRGFQQTRLSISRFSTFSHMLETFFAGYLQETLRNEFRHIYTIFSGGDDFFLVGPWNETIEFAQITRDRFTDFSAENKDLTFSAGLFLSKPHEPLSYCARLVEKRLRDSKAEEGKDSITLFGQTVHWDELIKILNEAQRIIKWLNLRPPVISRSFANKLRHYGEMNHQFEETKDTRWLRFVPLLIHDINRNLTRKEQSEAYAWAIHLSPTIEKVAGSDNLPFLRTIMEYVLTYTRS